MKSFESIAKAAYESFYAQINKSKEPFLILAWQQLPDITRNAWIAAAQTIADEIRQVH